MSVPPENQRTRIHPTLRYSTLRIAIFVVVAAVLRGLVALGALPFGGKSGALYILAFAILISSIISYFVLSRQRDAMSEVLVDRAERVKRKFEHDAAMEDDD